MRWTNTPVLMTDLTAGLALVPLVVADHKVGNEVQSPMGQVIVGGLFISTFLNLVLVPVPFARWSSAKQPRAGFQIGTRSAHRAPEKLSVA
jgi:multidrug efflux pump subunit AcrB